MVFQQCFGCCIVKPDQLFVQFSVGLVEEEVGKEEDVFSPVLKFGHAQGELIDTVVQILTESSFLDGLFQIFIRSGNQTHIYSDFFIGTYRTYFSFLQGT